MNCKHEFSCGVCSECGIAWSVYAEQSIKERDSLKSRLAKLEEIADGLAKRLEAHDSCYHLEYGTREADFKQLKQYQQYKEAK